MSIVGFIPARGGSKAIYKKNIKMLNNKPLINYTIDISNKCDFIDNTIVSTDDNEIAEISKEAGAKIPFIRPSEFAEDSTPDRPVLLHFLDWYFKLHKQYPELIVFLRPTSPLRRMKDIKSAIKKISSNDYFTGLRSVNKVDGIHHPYWMYKKENDILTPFVDDVDITNFYQKQLLPDCFRLNGAIDILRPQIILNSNNIYGKKMTFFEIDEETSIDIDTEFDFKMCEFILQQQTS